MARILLLIFFSLTLLSAKINCIVSILPEVDFLKKIGGDNVDISVMVQPGSSPHTYEPKPSQMIKVQRADIYFAIGVEFEKVWLNKFKTQNKNLKIANLSDGVIKTSLKLHNKKDPHIWISPKNLKIIARNIYKTLSHLDKKNSSFYKKNYKIFLSEIENTDKKIVNILKKVEKKSSFMVFHPAWGYFADYYNLVQISIEIDGKSPKPKELIKIIKKARQKNIKAIFVQPEFSDKFATIIAKELDIKVIKISPLNPNWSKNLINLASAIANN